ncbi:hypothetical protein GCK32_019152 [Trichostrongylus colubriformis]|uniref:Uncharacterized protein n=1 Tax=Trichostrongylus colubriformis TaxID=6319 RepID=A0AAN8FRU6_TRICO
MPIERHSSSRRRSLSFSHCVRAGDDKEDFAPRAPAKHAKGSGDIATESGPLHTVRMRVSSLIQNGIIEGQRFALSSDLWRYAKTVAHCDLLVTFKPNHNEEEMKQVVSWLVDIVCNRIFSPN